MKYSTLYQTLLLLTVGLFSGCEPEQAAPANEAAAVETAGSAISSEALDQAIHSAAAYLANQVNPDGTFIYQVNMNPQVRSAERYNILRHAGTIYSMAMYQSRYANPKLMDSIERSVQYLREHAISPLDKEGRVRAVWSHPEVNKTGTPLQAKLGGSGLGLVALLSYDQLRPGQIPLEELQALGRFIVYMQREDGSFFAKFIPEEGGRTDKWVSLYYPGEAALGLVMLYEKDPNPVWLHAAARAMGYLADTRKGQSDVPADHWALLATERLMRLDVQLPVSRNLLLHHAKQISGVMLASQRYSPKVPMIHGGFTAEGRTTPSATRMEGLLAAHEFIPEELPMHAYIAAAAPLGIEFLLNAQVKEGSFAGGYPRATYTRQGESEAIIHSNLRATEIRIDYVQHALSALIQYQDILNQK